MVIRMKVRPTLESRVFQLPNRNILPQEAEKIAWIWAFCWFVDFSLFVLPRDSQVTTTIIQWRRRLKNAVQFICNSTRHVLTLLNWWMKHWLSILRKLHIHRCCGWYLPFPISGFWSIQHPTGLSTFMLAPVFEKCLPKSWYNFFAFYAEINFFISVLIFSIGYLQMATKYIRSIFIVKFEQLLHN